MPDAFICDAVRTPFGRYAGTLKDMRPDDMLAFVLRVLKERNEGVDWEAVDDCIMGCANQAGEDNRDVARMALLLAGLPVAIPGGTVNRLCGSGLDAVGTAARAIRAGEADLMLAGGVESMTRAPFVMGKAGEAFSRSATIEDTTIGWRFVNPAMKASYGTDSMPETGENVAEEFNISREDQDLFAYRSQQKTKAAQEAGVFAREIAPVTIKGRKGDTIVDQDEYIRHGSTYESMASLKPAFTKDGSVTAGNASGLNDGAAALVLMTEDEAKRRGLKPLARIASWAHAGVDPEIMGTGPIPATRKALEKAGWAIGDLDLIESNEAFAAQSLSVVRELGLDPDKVNVNGGAIAIGHPIGASGARILTTLVHEMGRRDAKKGLATLCVGGGMGVALCVERD